MAVYTSASPPSHVYVILYSAEIYAFTFYISFDKFLKFIFKLYVGAANVSSAFPNESELIYA